MKALRRIKRIAKVITDKFNGDIDVIAVIKKDGTGEGFMPEKIISAINKSASRIEIVLSEAELELIVSSIVTELTNGRGKKKGIAVKVETIHGLVEKALGEVNKAVAESYMNFRNYKRDFGYALMDDIESQVKATLEEVDRENSNNNSRYISSKRTDIAQKFSKEMYQKLFLPLRVIAAIKTGYIYIHDLKDMLLPQFNCCLTNIRAILEGGFEMENVFYCEPKDVKTAIGQIGDVIMVISAQHYGGNTTPQIDKILAKYFKMSIEKYEKRYRELRVPEEILVEEARKDAYRELKQGLQGLEAKLNTVVSARGSFPFTTFSFGDVSNEYEADVCKAILEVRREGHGKPGFKKRLIFPKLVFLYKEELHDDGMQYEWLYNESTHTLSKCQYPDHIGKSHMREGKWVSPMGCRAYLSDYRDPETNELVFEGRFNIGAISLNPPMIYKKAVEEGKPFFEVLDYYLEMIRELHVARYEYLGKAQASSNPLMFTQGGAYGGYLKPTDRIAPLLESATASFGITALHELTILATGQSLKENREFAMMTMTHINKRIEEFKKEDGHLYAIYNTPAESLCGTQVKQFRDKYGVIKGVSDKEYFTNSNHLWVGEDVTMFEKQDLEIDLFKQSAGGHIGYVRVSNPSNLTALKAIVRRGLKLGFYQGVNFNACYCETCGEHGYDFGDCCPKCGSTDINEQNRTCGYLGFSKVRGDSTFNDAKKAEILARVSM